MGTWAWAWLKKVLCSDFQWGLTAQNLTFMSYLWVICTTFYIYLQKINFHCRNRLRRPIVCYSSGSGLELTLSKLYAWLMPLDIDLTWLMRYEKSRCEPSYWWLVAVFKYLFIQQFELVLSAVTVANLIESEDLASIKTDLGRRFNLCNCTWCA